MPLRLARFVDDAIERRAEPVPYDRVGMVHGFEYVREGCRAGGDDLLPRGFGFGGRFGVAIGNGLYFQ